MALRLFNTLGKREEEFKPLSPDRVTLYQCGPTVYWVQHLGNLRAAVLTDLIVRSLRYLGYEVEYVRNYTDVGHLTSDEDTGEDKVEKTAKQEETLPEAIAEKYIKIFEEDAHALDILEPTYKPRATKHIPEMIKLIETLLAKGYAYATDLAIYYDVTKFPPYSELSGQKIEEKKAEAGKGDVQDPQKRHPADFALWFFKAGTHEHALQTWPSPFPSPLVKNGEGFPGWHIECSAMSQKYLGDTLDLHLGGVEHIPVHHTNEIAQSEAATGKKFADYWIHYEHLLAGGVKMSKSEGNGYTLADVKTRGFDPLAVRYFFLQAHYRSKQNFTWEALEGAQTSLNNLRDKIKEWGEEKGVINQEFKNKFAASLEDDFNLPKALAVVWDLIKTELPAGDKKATVLDFDKVLALRLCELKKEPIPAEITQIAENRKKARQEQNWALSDQLRAQIELQGYFIKDRPGNEYEIEKRNT